MATKELTPQQTQDRSEACYQLHEQVKEDLRTTRKASWHLAQSLNEWDEASGWTALGYDHLNDWLADPDIGLTRSVYYRLLKGYRALTLRRVPEDEMAQLEPSKVDIVLPSIESGKVTLEDGLADTKALGWRDLREKYLGKKTKAPEDVEGEATEPEPEAPQDEVDEVTESVEEVVEGPDETEPEAEEAPVVGLDLGPRDEGVDQELEDALDAWIVLRDELMAVSGQSTPKIRGSVISPGVAGVDLIFERGGIVIDDDEPTAA